MNNKMNNKMNDELCNREFGNDDRPRLDHTLTESDVFLTSERGGLPSGIPVLSLRDKIGLGDDGHVNLHVEDSVSFLGMRMDD